ncbi:MAG: DUF4040 domain-containing protein [Caldithrix sp.]|nr:DUF4040 domain-containing protein [Caldithrix sp.]
MPTETWLIFILIFMILGSITALELKDILSSIISIGIVGLGVSVAFLFMQAPDLAIVQFLFEIFAMIILLRAFLKKDYHQESTSRLNWLLSGVTIIVLIAIFLFSISVFNALPPFGQPLLTTAEHYIAHGAAETGAANLVASVILDYRAYDTLGEITVLFTAILGSLTILRIQSQRKKEGSESS